MTIITNAFSLNMLPPRFRGVVSVAPLTLADAQGLAKGAAAAGGHADTAGLFERILGVPVPTNRATVALDVGMGLLVGQYRGPRLPEGATELPEGASIEWAYVTAQAD